MRATLIATTSAMVMLVLDSSIVGVLLPSMRADLHLGPGAQAWIVAIYLATLAVLLPVGGRLCDALGAARAFSDRHGRLHRRLGRDRPLGIAVRRSSPGAGSPAARRPC